MSESLLERPFLRVVFECCNIYQRIYRDRSEQYYVGRCPRCLRSITFKIASNGTAVRDFRVR